MSLKQIFIILLFGIIAFTTSCKDAQYLINNASKQKKFKYASKWYNEEKWSQATPMLEHLIPEFKGTDTSELLYYMLADAYYFSKEYMVAAYHYKNFRDLYPRSYKSEVASYRVAECYRSEIPRLELEQRDTEKAISYYKSFISNYPNSPMVEIAYKRIGELNKIIENKARSAGDLYYKTKNYRAAAVTYKNLLNDYPTISGYEEIAYKIADSYMKFAENSILTKKSQRYETALNSNQKFLNRFPASEYVKKVKENIAESRMNLLLSSFENASFFSKVEERPFYFNEAIELFEEYKTDFKKLPSELKNFEDKCKLGIMKTYFGIMDDTKDQAIKNEYYGKVQDYYFAHKDGFNKKENQYKQFVELYKKAKKIIHIMNKLSEYKSRETQTFVETRNLDEIYENTGNLYQSICIISKRSNQIASELKNELHFKLEDMRKLTDEIDEISESREQIDLSVKYERLAHPTIIATEEFLNEELEFNYLEEDEEEK